MRCATPASHSNKGWETFTDKVIDIVDKYGGANIGDTRGVGRGIVFLAWGAWAAKRVAKLDEVCLHVLTCFSCKIQDGLIVVTNVLLEQTPDPSERGTFLAPECVTIRRFADVQETVSTFWMFL